MPMMMPPQYMFNPYDQGMDLEYSPITQLVSSIAHLFEMHQKSKERMEDSSPNAMFPEFSQLQQLRGRPSANPRFQLIPYTHEGLLPSVSSVSSASKLVNSIPNENIPPVMWRIGDLIGRNDAKHKDNQENVYDTSKIKGFPIVKSSSDESLVLRDTEDKKMQSWTILEIARKILGVDEIPTASEGNAIAQLMEQLRKDKERTN